MQRFLKAFQLIINQLWFGFRLFQQKKMTIVIAACTFFTILCALPLLLFALDVLSSYVFINDKFSNFFISQVWQYLPFVEEPLKIKIQQILTSKSITEGSNIVNIVFLCISSTGLFRVILIGLHILTEQKFDRPLKIYSKGILSAALLLGFFVIQFFLTPLLISFKKVFIEISQTSFADFLKINTWIDTIVFESWAQIIQLIFFILFFYFVFTFLFKGKSYRKDIWLGTAVMTIMFHAGQSAFYLYINIARERLVLSYGEFISFITLILWVYFMFFAFFYSSAVILAKKYDPKLL